MENKAHAMAAGIFVVAVAALLLALASWLTRETGKRDAYEISTRETVTGLQSQAPVRFRGVEVGKVAAIGFDPKVQGNVLIRMEVAREAPMTTDTYASLGFQGVTGLSFIQLQDHGNPGKALIPNDAQPPRIPLQPGLISKLSDRGEEILDRVDQATARLNLLLGDENQKRFAGALDNLGQAASDTSRMAQRVDTTLNQRLDPALVQATTTLRTVQSGVDQIGRTAAAFEATAQRFNEKDGPIDRLAEGSQALSHAADSFNGATLPRINRVTDDASRAVRQLGRTAAEIGDNPQSLLFGNALVAPGPGEPGFVPPGDRQ
jgi:phospholipid/cholesterol/gamma-HCH transport system substrate-binding protein